MNDRYLNEVRSLITKARESFYADLLETVLVVDSLGVPSNADKGSKQSVQIAKAILEQVGVSPTFGHRPGQQAGSAFEEVCARYLRNTFPHLAHIRPGCWKIGKVVGGRTAISQYDQYQHLLALDEAASSDKRLAAALGTDYLIKPDVVISRFPEIDEKINELATIVDDNHASLSSLRKANSHLPILHASISCKWTLRSDRAQNARSEALNLIRNRKGKLPHVVVVTGEPTPSRIASLALGTGDIDCVYHYALPELLESVRELHLTDAEELLIVMVEGKRLRDISDLPLDLVI